MCAISLALIRAKTSPYNPDKNGETRKESSKITNLVNA